MIEADVSHTNVSVSLRGLLTKVASRYNITAVTTIRNLDTRYILLRSIRNALQLNYNIPNIITVTRKLLK